MAEAGTVVSNLATAEVAAVYQAHLARLTETVRFEAWPVVKADQTGRIDATYAFYASAYYKGTARQLMRPAWFSLSIALVFALLACAFLAWS